MTSNQVTVPHTIDKSTPLVSALAYRDKDDALVLRKEGVGFEKITNITPSNGNIGKHHTNITPSNGNIGKHHSTTYNIVKRNNNSNNITNTNTITTGIPKPYDISKHVPEYNEYIPGIYLSIYLSIYFYQILSDLPYGVYLSIYLISITYLITLSTYFYPFLSNSIYF
jgi:hypothetical protein